MDTKIERKLRRNLLFVLVAGSLFSAPFAFQTF